MKELFTGFFSVSLSGSLVICVILLLRLLFKKIPKSLICVLWLVTFVRLLLPFQIETPWSLRPATPVISEDQTQLLFLPESMLNGTIPDFVPQSAEPGFKVVVDYVAVAAIVWAVGAAAMLLYMLITYWLLRYRVRHAELVEKKVFAAQGLQSAFLLGYFSPRIYLPVGMDRQSVELVIAHELMHKKRGDNWLKLIGFICVAVHWFNPLVWLAYILLCRDVEDACDEQVVKNLGAEERKAYSVALLACGKPKKGSSVCPVAFGEISIRQRIKNVLGYRRPAVWISIIAVAAILFVSIFLLTDPINKDVLPPYYEELVQLIGKPADEVCAGLGITQDQLGEEIPRGIYQTSVTVEYMDAEFFLVLMFNDYNNLLGSFRYMAQYEGISEEAAKDAAAISRQLWKNYGKGYQWEDRDDPKRLSDITAEEILEIYNNVNERTGSYTVGDQWDLTRDAPKNVQSYLAQVEISEYWQKVHGEAAKRYNVSPHYYLAFSSGVDPQNQTSYIILDFQTGWQPGHYSVMVTSDRDG